MLRPGQTYYGGVAIHPTALVAQGVEIAESATVGPGCIVGWDSGPSSQPTRLLPDSVLESAVTVARGVIVGRGATARSGAVVRFNVPDGAIVEGNPAQIVAQGGLTSGPFDLSQETELPGRAHIVDLQDVHDLRGRLLIADESRLGFSVARVFFVVDVAPHLVRGTHAHRKCTQALVALSGSLTCSLHDGQSRAELRLKKPNQALVIPPGVWASQFDFSPGAVLAVAANRVYEAEDYIHDFNHFLEWSSRNV